MKYFRIGTSTGPKNRYDLWPLMRQGLIAMGWSGLTDLTRLVGDQGQLRDAVAEMRKREPEYLMQIDPERSIRYICDQVTRFVTGLQEDDIVLAARGDRILGVGQVTGPYEFKPAVDLQAPHIRRAVWFDTNDWVAPSPPGRQHMEGFRTTIWSITDPDTVNQARRRLPSPLAK